MQCENNLCIYWCNHACTLTEISLDTGGRCESCILINPDENFLKAERERILAGYEEK